MPPLPNISFGTDGWRAIIGDDYTFENVRACATAVALDVLATGQQQRGVAVGYDTRFQSENFAQATAEVIASHNIPVHLSDLPLPTPALSYAVTTHNAACGVMITASHNPPEYNGFKVKSQAGGSAPPEQVERIEAHLAPFAERKGREQAERRSSGVCPGTGAGFPPLVGEMSEGQRGPKSQAPTCSPPTSHQLASLVDIDSIKSAGINIAVDSMHGSGAGIVATLLEGGKTKVTEIRSEINPAFPGMKQPEPVDDNLHPLIDLINNQDFDVGLATDGDADRLGVVAENGTYLTTLEVFSMLFHHLKSRRNLPGGAACTITMSSMMDRLAEHHSTDLYRTPVGFKFVGPAMLDNQCVLGGEESGGYAFAGHIPERDGPLSALFFLESMATSGKTPTQLLDEIHQITGPHTFRRIDIQFTPDQRDRIATAVNGKAPTSLGGVEVVTEDRRDGVRLDLSDGGWAVVSLSGTEPLLRIYAEASSKELTRCNPERFSGAFGRLAPFAKRKGREQAKRCERGMPGAGRRGSERRGCISNDRLLSPCLNSKRQPLNTTKLPSPQLSSPWKPPTAPSNQHPRQPRPEQHHPRRQRRKGIIQLISYNKDFDQIPNIRIQEPTLTA